MSVLRRRMMMAPPRMGYIQEGLLLHLDGIWNTRRGHAASALSWEDLSGHDVKTAVDELAQWEADGLHVSSKHGAAAQIQPFGTEPLTIEVVLTVLSAPGNAVILSTDDISANGLLSGTLDVNHNGYFAAYWRGANSYGPRFKGELPIPSGKKMSFSGVSYENNAALYLDGIEKNSVAGGKITESTGNLTIGYTGYRPYAGVDGIIHSVRIYGRVLTADEIAHNYAIDKRRFGL